MKFLLVAVCLIAAVSAEAPRFRSQQRLRSRSRFFARQEEAPADVPAPAAEDYPYPAASSPAPYGASGFRPDGPAFDLPVARAATPEDSYGAPVETPTDNYGTPAAAYGAPLPGDEEATTLEPLAEGVDTSSNDQSGRYRQSQRLRQGQFFNSRLVSGRAFNARAPARFTRF